MLSIAGESGWRVELIVIWTPREFVPRLDVSHFVVKWCGSFCRVFSTIFAINHSTLHFIPISAPSNQLLYCFYYVFEWPVPLFVTDVTGFHSRLLCSSASHFEHVYLTAKKGMLGKTKYYLIHSLFFGFLMVKSFNLSRNMTQKFVIDFWRLG